MRPAVRNRQIPPFPLEEFGEQDTTEPTENHRRKKDFHVTINMAIKDPRQSVMENPYYGRFKVYSSPIQNDLAQSVPLYGLSEVSMDRVQTRERELRQLKVKAAERKTLRQLYEEASNSQGDADDGVELNAQPDPISTDF